MSKRPRIKLTPTVTDRVLDVLSSAVVAAMWVAPIAVYNALPAEIPRHFNAGGSVDAYGPKAMIWMLPAVASILYSLLTILNKYPHLFNYAVPVTATNALRLYTQATRMLRWLKLVVLLVLAGVLYGTCSVALQQGPGLPSWFLAVAIALLCIPFLLGMYGLFFHKKTVTP